MINTAGIQNFADTDLLNLARAAYAACLIGKSYAINGRVYTREDLNLLQDAIMWLEERIADVANAGFGGSVSLASFGEPANTDGNGPGPWDR